MTWSPSRGSVHAPVRPAPAAWALADLALEADARAAGPGAALASALARAEAEAAALGERLEAETAAAYASGLEAGRAEGRREEAARLASAAAALERALDQVEQAAARGDVVEANVAALAVAVARHLIGRELAGDAEAIAALVRRAVAHFPPDEPLRVRLSPQDLASVSTAASTAEAPLAPGRPVRWQADPAVEPGGCVVEGRERILDGRLDRALERVYRSLAG